MEKLRQNKAKILVVAVVIAAAFLCYAAVSGMGYKIRLARNEFDISSLSKRSDITMSFEACEDGVLSYSVNNQSGGLIKAHGGTNYRKLLRYEDGEWYEVKTYSMSKRVQDLDAETTIDDPEFRGGGIKKMQLDLCRYTGVDAMPEGRYMLLLELWEWEAGIDKSRAETFLIGMEFEI